ncbi:MAG TPA: Uma2 family endonuclease [Panacibacter sp.]|nr:Uma2 family endonuclease [Panacibacter sp.]
MKQVEIDKKFNSQEEYFLFEEASELKHELINGNLFEMSGVSKFHNYITRRLTVLLDLLLKGNNLELYLEGYKVRVPDGNFFYPDVIICNPDPQKYFTDEPVMLIEVLSESTRKFDLTDKFIQYKKIESLNYYLCVEPEQQVVIFYFKNENGEWLAETYTKDEDAINLSALNISFTLKDIYNP